MILEMCVCAKSIQSCPTLCDPSVTPLSLGFSWQEYWSGLPCPPPGDLPKPQIKLAPRVSPAGGFFISSAAWECQIFEQQLYIFAINSTICL